MKGWLDLVGWPPVDSLPTYQYELLGRRSSSVDRPSTRTVATGTVLQLF